MKNLYETCIEFFKKEEMRLILNKITKQLFSNIFNEIYIYIWIICIYNIVLILMILANFYLLMKLLHNSKTL
jgi:hypothetical protein